MMDRFMLYNIIYALMARDGRESVLFGSNAPLACEAFERSLAGTRFPELWFEVPLYGDPWFDLHVLAERAGLEEEAFESGTCGGVPDVFKWFSAQDDRVRQLALSWDVSSGDVSCPAVQLLRSNKDTQTICDFLEAAGTPDRVSAYRSFESSLPDGWFACYTGVFPARETPFLRVECIPSSNLQRAYAESTALLSEHLRQVGVSEQGGSMLERCQLMADTPFQLEFQFDVLPDGSAGPMVGASIRFAGPSGEEGWQAYEVDGVAGDFMQNVESWGLADGRWRLLADTAFAKNLKNADGEECVMYSFPAFIKLRWHGGIPLDAKAYLIAGVEGFRDSNSAR